MKKLDNKAFIIISIILDIVMLFLFDFGLAKAILCLALLVNIIVLIKEVQNDRE